MRSILMAVTLVLAPLSVAQAQQTVTTRDIIELSKSGLPAEVLIALIDVHRPVFPVDTVTLKGLKDAGVAPNVIVAMIKSGRELPVAPAATEEAPAQASVPPPEVIYVEQPRRDEPAPRVYYEDRVREVVVPVYVAVPVRSRPIVRPEHTPAEPVYWGWGGKPRPDGWKTAADLQKDAKIPREPQKK
jgi:hypothetical protein